MARARRDRGRATSNGSLRPPARYRARSRALASQPGREGAHRGSQRHARAGRVSRAGACVAGRATRRTRRRRADAATRRAPSRRTGAWQGQLAEAGYVGITWPAEYGGQGRGPLEQVDRQPGDREGGRAGDPRHDRRRHARPDDHRPRHRRAEAALPRPDAARRRGLVPALLRAGRRLGPRRHPGARQARRTTAPGACPARRCGRRTPSSPPTACCSRAPNPDAPKHKGLTMFVVPMDAEGVTIRPLRQISGEAEFNEVFFDDVLLEPGSRGRRGRRRLGRRADDADVRAPHDRRSAARAWATVPTASRARSPTTRRRARDPEVRAAPRRAGDGAARAALHRLPPADRVCSAARSPAPRPASAR